VEVSHLLVILSNVANRLGKSPPLTEQKASFEQKLIRFWSQSNIDRFLDIHLGVSIHIDRGCYQHCGTNAIIRKHPEPTPNATFRLLISGRLTRESRGKYQFFVDH